MRGVTFDGRSVRLRTDLPIPQPVVGESLLKVRRVGLCDTDLQLAKGYMGFIGILGHEFVGETEDGKRVAGEINNPCRRCESCLAGRQRHCPHRTVLGILGHDGAMADFVTIPTRNLHLIPDSVEDRRAVFIEPLAAAFRIVEQVAIESSTRMAVVGDGKLGLLCAWAARSAGARVSLVGKHRSKLDLAGVDIETIALDDVSKHSKTFDIVADCTGSSTGLPTALGLVRPCGTLVLKTTIAGDYTINLAPIVIDEITVVGSRCGPFPRAIAALATNEIDVVPLIGAEYALDQAEIAFVAAAERGAKKILLTV